MSTIPSRPGRFLIRVAGTRALTGTGPDLATIAAALESSLGSASHLAAGAASDDSPVVIRLQNASQGLHALSVLLDDNAKAELMARHGADLQIEPDDELQMQAGGTATNRGPAPINHFPAANALELRFEIVGAEGSPLADAAVEVHGATWLDVERGRTGADGRVTLSLSGSTLGTITRLVIRPVDGHWGLDTERPALVAAVDGVNRIALEPLPTTAGEVMTWGLRTMGLDRAPMPTGPGSIRVAVIDSGISNDHPDLAPTGGLDFNPSDDPTRTWSQDGSGHGTHVAGICAALHNQMGIVGAAAPGVELFGLRVFPEARVSKLVLALDWCIENGIDVVNLSLGSAASNETMREAVARAVAAGVVVVAAAGNSGQRVMFPAAFDGVVAVAALGDATKFPPSSPHRAHVGQHREGDLFAASFSCSGPEIDVIAPGVAIVSTIPGGGHAAWDGTSMACPFVTGFVARILQTDESLQAMPRSRARAEAVILTLRGSCRSLDMPRDLQGAGLPVWPARTAVSPPSAAGSRATVLALLDQAIAAVDREIAARPPS
jgi:subtilisin family serine protease